MPPLETPVAFIIFNRPEKTARVFAEIRKARPKQLFIIADGPRTEAERVITDQVRSVVANIDWDCEVKRKYSETNLGCRLSPPSGVSWVFEHVECAIIIEDDGVPEPSFFSYCQELLERYRDDERIMHIGGTNFMPYDASKEHNESYFFSIAPDLWGWATWRRAWREHYDIKLTEWPEVRDRRILDDIFPDLPIRERWEHRFSEYYAGRVDSWDGQWAFACLINHGLSIVPARNLMSNIGFDAESTHPLDYNDPGSKIPTYPMQFPLKHPLAFVPNGSYDAYVWKHFHHVNQSLQDNIRLFLKSQTPGLYQWLKRIAKYHERTD